MNTRMMFIVLAAAVVGYGVGIKTRLRYMSMPRIDGCGDCVV